VSPNQCRHPSPVYDRKQDHMICFKITLGEHQSLGFLSSRRADGAVHDFNDRATGSAPCSVGALADAQDAQVAPWRLIAHTSTDALGDRVEQRLTYLVVELSIG